MILRLGLSDLSALLLLLADVFQDLVGLHVVHKVALQELRVAIEILVEHQLA